MASKIYTAKAMREAALFAETVEVTTPLYGRELDEIAAMLRQAADAMEREKKYEYAVKWLAENSVANNMGERREWAESIVRDVGASKVRLVRREVGEWEEVKG